MVRSVGYAVVCVLFVLAMPMAFAAGPDEEPPAELPGWLESRVVGLAQEKIDFLRSPKAERFAGTRERLHQRLESKSTEEIAAYIDGMMTVVQASKFNPDTDPASIPLNTGASEFNGWKVMQPQSLNPKREPGPFQLSYYANSYRSGIRTFADAPVAIYPEDLVAGKVDVAIVGAPLDMGSYYRGQRFGPQAMRNEYGAGGIDMNTMLDPSKVLSIVDYGDIAIDNMSTELSMHHVRERGRRDRAHRRDPLHRRWRP
jgi:guanidinobutyrase